MMAGTPDICGVADGRFGARFICTVEKSGREALATEGFTPERWPPRAWFEGVMLPGGSLQPPS